ncbi:hypothetical protein SynA1544_02519 [Synechococcus sp. A15-44]|nr:hypothetical protein SynA1544_02519 [Synechococcus sp. A15-44]
MTLQQGLEEYWRANGLDDTCWMGETRSAGKDTPQGCMA